MRITKPLLVSGFVGLAVGVIVLLGIRFITYNPKRVHYHANFAVYIQGQRETFNSPLYYEEKGGNSCAVDTISNPAERVHMHDNVNDTVHVHDNAVTWGEFFQNLHWAVGDGFIKTSTQVYLADDTNQVNYLINGHAYQDVSNEVIHDQDRLLVDYGTPTASRLQKELASVSRTALAYDQGKDPAACQGNIGPSFKDRFKHLL